MNFGKVLGLNDVLLINYRIKWVRIGTSQLGHNFFDFQKLGNSVGLVLQSNHVKSID